MGSKVEQWSRVAAANRDAAKGGWRKRMTRKSIDNQGRDNLAALRTLFQAAEWFDRLQEHENAFTVERSGDTTFTVSDLTGMDATSRFPIGSWVKVTGTGSPTVAFGYTTAVSTYALGAVTVTLDGIVDAAYASAVLPSTGVTKVECFLSNRIRQAAFHPVGTTLLQAPAEVAQVDDYGDAAFEDTGHGGGLDADQVGTVHAAALQLRGTRIKLAEGTGQVGVGTAEEVVEGCAVVTFPLTPDNVQKFLVTARCSVWYGQDTDVDIRLRMGTGVSGGLGDAQQLIEQAERTFSGPNQQYSLAPTILTPNVNELLTLTIETNDTAGSSVDANGTYGLAARQHQRNVPRTTQLAQTFIQIEPLP